MQHQIQSTDTDPSWWDDGSILMAVDLGFDESGAGDVLLVGMQMAPVQKAKKFKTKWSAELKRVGVPFFHSKEFGSSGGIFEHLSRTQREELLQVLSAHLRQRLGGGLTFKVTLSDYNAKSDNEFRSKWGAAYTMLTQMLILGAHLYMNAYGLGNEVNILIEDGHRNSQQALQHFQAIKNTGHPRIKILSVGFGSKMDHPILQAADMLAYSEWQKLTNGDMRIYDALHVKGSRYKTHLFDCDPEVSGIAVQGALADELKRKLWGQRRPKPDGV